jgi:hypothetical protein
MRTDGTHLRQLTHFPSTDPHPVWPVESPLGGQIAFIGSTSNSDPDIWVSRLDGTALRRITTTPHRDDVDQPKSRPDWSPDGHHLVFTAYHDPLNRAEPPTTWVTEADADGGNVTRLGQGIEPLFSPDGRSIIYRDRAWYRRSLATGKTTQMSLPTDYPGDISSWQPQRGTKRLSFTLHLRAHYRPRWWTARLATLPAQPGDEIVLRAYRRVEGHWDLVFNDPNLIGPHGRYSRVLSTEGRWGTCKITARYTGDTRYRPVRRTRIVPCSPRRRGS